VVPKTQRPRGAAPRGARKSIVSTKLAAPAPPVGFVPRPRLDRQLDEYVNRRVTLVSAHPGTGKTVLLASWAGSRQDVAWVTVERDDNWSPRFWAAIERALDTVDPRQRATGRREEDPVARIAARLSSKRTPVVLVLDDLHEIESPIVLRELDALLARAPGALRVVLATRSDPALRLQRLRLSGELAEIRASDLALTPEECRELLGPLTEQLTDEDIETLWSRTEGWAAGVRLAALSLAGSNDGSGFISHFAGDERAVADYLLTEVLNRQPLDRREFLLRTCVPDAFTIELAATLSGNSHAGRLLAALETENFLVSTHEEHGDVYRFHALLRDFLRAELARRRPREVVALNRRSAQWYWAHGDADLAFRHALVGEDWELADFVAAHAWHTVLMGVDARASYTSSEIPPSAYDGRPGLALRAAAGLLAGGDRQAAERTVEKADAELTALDSDRQALLEPVILVLRIGFARLDGDYELVRRAALRLLDLPAWGTFEVGRRAGVQYACAKCSLGSAQLANGEFEEAELSLEEAFARAREVGLDVVAVHSLSELALLEAFRGRLRRAAQYGTEALKFAQRRNWEGLYHLSGARLALAWAHYNWDDVEGAMPYIDDAVASAQHWGDRTGKVGAAEIGARLLATDGPEGAAKGLRLVRGVRSELDGWTLPVWLSSCVATAEGRLLAARGDLVEARAAIDASAHGNGEGEDSLVRARLLLASGSAADALDELDGAKPLDGLEWSRRIEADVLEAVARRELNDRSGAARAIEQALALAEPNGFRRPFVDGGPVVQGLLVDQIRHGTNHRSLVADLIASFERRAGTVAITKAELLEPLSEREHAVLRYLPTMMSNAEIASELFVSVNTVKTHLKSVYRKLGTTRRRDAVERARRLDLL
jgi:LuxR family transcriptional regulator, maltose regulon positive regulatory protein